MDWLSAHRKAILAAVAAVLILVVDQETADIIVAVVGSLLTLLVPNDQQAVNRIYHKPVA